MRARGLPGPTRGIQDFPARARGRKEGECSCLHVGLLINSVFLHAEPRLGNLGLSPGRRHPSPRGMGRGRPAVSTDPNLSTTPRPSSASPTATAGHGDKGSRSPAGAGTPSLPPQGAAPTVGGHWLGFAARTTAAGQTDDASRGDAHRIHHHLCWAT